MRSFLKPLNSLVEDSNIVQTKYDELDETARSEGIWSYASHHDENHRTTKLYHAAVLAVLLRMGSVLTGILIATYIFVKYNILFYSILFYFKFQT
jgi:hypothetical protein